MLEDYGRKLQQGIQDALSTGNFEPLKNTIQDTVNVTVKGIKEELKPFTQNYTKQNEQGSAQPQRQGETEKTYTQQVQENLRREKEERRQSAQVTVYPNGKKYLPGEGKAIALQIVGGILSALGLGLTAVMALGYFLLTIEVMLTTVLLFLGIFVIGVGLLTDGVIRGKIFRRFRQYLKFTGITGFYSLQRLAEDTGSKYRSVVKNIERMIERKFFNYARLDTQKTVLILDADTYKKYETAQKDYERRQAEEEIRRADPEYEEKKRVIAQGREYIAQIRTANDALPGKEISDKLDRLEQSCTELFDYVEQHPVSCTSLKTALEYYLPTTMKLVQGYQDFEKEASTPQITKAKTEILEILDTIPAAFDKLRETFYQEKIIDISSDIATMKTVFAQDGLTEETSPWKSASSEKK